jgi:hypothetical protein
VCHRYLTIFAIEQKNSYDSVKCDSLSTHAPFRKTNTIHIYFLDKVICLYKCYYTCFRLCEYKSCYHCVDEIIVFHKECVLNVTISSLNVQFNYLGRTTFIVIKYRTL